MSLRSVILGTGSGISPTGQGEADHRFPWNPQGSGFTGAIVTDIVSGTNTEKEASVGLYFCNFTENVEYITIYTIGSGDHAADSNTILKSLDITGRETFQFPNEKFILSYGEKIAASGRFGNRVTATATYIDI
jgi:hypothetical protein